MSLPDLMVHTERFSVCRLSPEAPLPAWVNQPVFWSATRTSDELSVVLPEKSAPQNIPVENGWRMIQIQGPIDFGLTGILSGILNPLAEAKIGIFAISTYDTDYILIKEDQFSAALETLQNVGYKIK